MQDDSKTYLIYSDLHFTNKNKHYKRDADGLSDLLKRQMEFVRHLYKEGEEKKVDGIIFLGDLTDEDMIDTYVLSCLFELSNLAKNASFPSYFIEGNHGITDRKNKYSIIGALSSLLPNCFYECRMHVESIHVSNKKVDLYFLPYGNFHEMKDLCANLEPNEDSDCNLLFLHGPVLNAEMDNGLPSMHGIELDEPTLEVFNLVLAGDFHRPQQMNMGQVPFVYCGAPFALTRGQDFPKIYRELKISVLNDQVNLSLQNHTNPYELRILTIQYEDFMKNKLSMNLSSNDYIHIDDVPSGKDRLELEEYLSQLNLYNFKLKLKVNRPQTNPSLVNEKAKLSDQEILKLVAKNNIEDPELLKKIVKIVDKIVSNQN